MMAYSLCEVHMIRQRQPSIPIRVEVRDRCAVASFKGHKHKFYEDRFRLLTASVPFVAARNAGQLYVVADGVGSAPMGANAAQHLCSRIDDFFKGIECSVDTLQQLLCEINQEIFSWGLIAGTERPQGACAASIAWIRENRLCLFHSGDTRVWLIRDGQCKVISHDHVNDDGHLLRYFGRDGMVCELTEMNMEDGDQLLMSSDGILSAGVQLRWLADICGDEGDPDRIARAIAAYAYTRTQDDVTVLCIDHAF